MTHRIESSRVSFTQRQDNRPKSVYSTSESSTLRVHKSDRERTFRNIYNRRQYGRSLESTLTLEKYQSKTLNGVKVSRFQTTPQFAQKSWEPLVSGTVLGFGWWSNLGRLP
jgi:hypothetical protein